MDISKHAFHECRLSILVFFWVGSLIILEGYVRKSMAFEWEIWEPMYVTTTVRSFIIILHGVDSKKQKCNIES